MLDDFCSRANEFHQFSVSKVNLPIFYLNAINLGYNTTKKSANFLKLSIITTRLYLGKFKKEGLLTSRIDKNSKHKQLIYLLTGKGKENLKHYKKLIKNEKY